jgi:lysylphosphatidylglycerol synthetase-like protein (DUF2156 family)
MTAAVLACGLALRSGMAMRRSRRFRSRRSPGLREKHLAIAKPAVAAIVLGFIGGPISTLWLRDWEPLRTFHAWIGIAAAALFIAAMLMGRRLERRESRAFDIHALLGLFAMLAALVAFVAGFVLLP